LFLWIRKAERVYESQLPSLNKAKTMHLERERNGGILSGRLKAEAVLWGWWPSLPSLFGHHVPNVIRILLGS
jgi:hypothetical protein